MSDIDSSEQSQSAAKAKPSKMLIVASLIGGLVIGALGGGVFVGPLLAKKVAASPAASHDEEAELEHDAEPGKKDDKGGAVVHLLENLVLNPAGSGGTRFLMVAVAVEVKDDKINQEMTTRDAEMRDAVLRLFGEKTVEQLADVGLRETMKRELSDSLNARFKARDAVRRVYFPQFVIQ